jgi:NAD(P)-dependent dehydrogenase (short-subunit alcohol dehydrogenase family)
MTSTGSGLFDLRGKVAVVTGGNRGIGLGLARGLAKAGASISIWARDAEQSAAAKVELESLGAEVQVMHCDVSSEQAVADATRETIAHFGRIDSGFANAGFGEGSNALEMDLEEWRRITAVNLDGVFLTLRHIGSHFKDREGGGKLVAISSISAVFGSPTQPHYAASKAGVESLVRAMSVRLAKYDVQVNAIQPGWIVTNATAPVLDHESFKKMIEARTPARRWGDISDFEGIAVYLASDASRFHTGDTIRIDGGYSIF